MDRAFLARSLDHLVDRFAAGDDDAGQAALRDVYGAIDDEDAGALVLDAIVARLDGAPAIAGAWLALLGGAVLEDNVHDPKGFADALAAPLRRALVQASPFLRRVLEEADRAPLGEDDDGDDVTGRLRPAVMADLAGVDPDGHAALVSLDTWYRPVVAAWSRHPAALVAARRDAAFVDLLGACDGVVSGATWMTTLTRALVDEPLVFLFPELGGEAWALRAFGVVDNGQLSVLLDEALRDPLARMGFDAPADADVLAIMKGDGPQTADGGFDCGFHLYPWQAMDPSSSSARAGVFQWRAPGGTGSHSLPADFRPGDLVPLGGVRVVLVTGKQGPPPFATVVRSLPAVRTFSSLPARLSQVRRLPDDEAAAWRALVVRQVEASA